MYLNLRNQLDSKSELCKHIVERQVLNKQKFSYRHKILNSWLNLCNTCVCVKAFSMKDH
jgi:hypothetical protein